MRTRRENHDVCQKHFNCDWSVLALQLGSTSARNGCSQRSPYSETPLTAVVFGIEMEMGRALAAAIAGALVTLVATGKNPERWAFVIAGLEIIRRTSFSRTPPEQWYSIMKYTAILFPAAACIVSAYLVAYFCKKHSDV